MFYNTDFLVSDEIQLKLQKTVEGNAEKEWLPAYHFAVCDKHGREMGVCDLRIGHNPKTYYGGNIGYRISEEYRGHHYAGKACFLNRVVRMKYERDGFVLYAGGNDPYGTDQGCAGADGNQDQKSDTGEM